MINYYATAGIGISLVVMAIFRAGGMVSINGVYIMCAALSSVIFIVADILQFTAESLENKKKRERTETVIGSLIMFNIITLTVLPWVEILQVFANDLIELTDALSIGALGAVVIFSSIKDLIKQGTTRRVLVRERDEFKNEMERYKALYEEVIGQSGSINEAASTAEQKNG